MRTRATCRAPRSRNDAVATAGRGCPPTTRTQRTHASTASGPFPRTLRDSAARTVYGTVQARGTWEDASVSPRPPAVLAWCAAAHNRRSQTRLRPVTVTAGTMLFRTGDEGDTCYLVEERRADGHDLAHGEVLATLGPGSFVGELAMLLGEPRSATVTAVTDSKLLELRRGDLGRADGVDTRRSRCLQPRARPPDRAAPTSDRSGDTGARRASCGRPINWPTVARARSTPGASRRRVGAGALPERRSARTRRGGGRVQAPRYGGGDGRPRRRAPRRRPTTSRRRGRVVSDAEHVLVLRRLPRRGCAAAAPADASSA